TSSRWLTSTSTLPMRVRRLSSSFATISAGTSPLSGSPVRPIGWRTTSTLTGYGKRFPHLDDMPKRLDAVTDLAYGAHSLHEQGIAGPQRFDVYGGNYGGFMVLAALAQYPELWAAGIDMVGIANFITFLQNTGPWRRDLRIAEYG